MIAIGEALEHSVDLLRFFGQFHLHQEFSNCHVDGVTKESETSHVLPQCRLEKVIVRFRQDARDRSSGNGRLQPREILGRGLAFFALGIRNRFASERERPGLGSGAGGRRAPKARGPVTRERRFRVLPESLWQVEQVPKTFPSTRRRRVSTGEKERGCSPLVFSDVRYRSQGRGSPPAPEKALALGDGRS